MCDKTQKNYQGEPRLAEDAQLASRATKEKVISYTIGGNSISIDHTKVTSDFDVLYSKGELKIKKLWSKTKDDQELVLVVKRVTTKILFNELKKRSVITIDKNGSVHLPN